MNRTKIRQIKKMMYLQQQLGGACDSGADSEFNHRRGGRRRHEFDRGPGPHRRRGGGQRRPRVSRGEVRVGVLAVLQDQPMHGYQIMQELEERSAGAWQPSPGSIYPTLQQLADEGLVTSEAVDGKNVFSLTEDGQSALLANEGPKPWERFTEAGGVAHGNLRRSVHQLGAAARQVAMTGSAEHVDAANKILADARKALYRLLAEDDADI